MPKKIINICICCKHEIYNKVKSSMYCRNCERFIQKLRGQVYSKFTNRIFRNLSRDIDEVMYGSEKR